MAGTEHYSRAGYVAAVAPGAVQRHQRRRASACARCSQARTVFEPAYPGLRWAADDSAVQGRAVEPDLSAGHAESEIRLEAQAPGQTVAVGACCRSRISGDQGFASDGLSRA